MKKTIIISLISLLINLLFINTSHSKTTVTTTGLAADITNFDSAYTSLVNDIDSTAKTNGPFVVDAFALANILGYPIGKAYLGSLPHFELGFSAGAGCTNMKYFDKDVPPEEKGAWPMIIPSAVAHFGIGIGSGFDILGKFFYLDKTVYDPKLSTGKAQDEANTDTSSESEKALLKDFKIYSAGAKIRYNIIDKIPLLPILLEFSGITVSLGGDFMLGKFKLGGDYQQDLSDSEVQISGLPENIDMQFNGTYDAIIEWSIFSLTTQVIGYIDLFYFFSLYTGFGLTGNVGFFNIEFDGTGELSSSNFAALTGSPQVGTMEFITKNKFRPGYVIPAYIIGLEINILVVKLNVESMVNLRNGRDVNIQVGTRIGI